MRRCFAPAAPMHGRTIGCEPASRAPGAYRAAMCVSWTTARVAGDTAEASGLDRDGLWFIGVGALVVAVAFLWQGPLAGLSGRPVGRGGTRRDRLLYAVGGTG